MGTVVAHAASPTGLALQARAGHFSFTAAVPGSGPPRMRGFVGFPAAGTFCFDLDLINDGGSASSYVLGPQEAGNIDTIIIPGTSKIMFTMPSAPEDYYFWDSDIAATNGSGEHTRQLFFDNEEFDFEFADNPLLSCP